MNQPIHSVVRTPKAVSLLLSEQTLHECPGCQESFLTHKINIQITPHDGTMFLKILEAKKPDAALLEVFMPGLDALEIKKQHDMRQPAAKTVFLATGPFYNDSIIKELIDAGFAYYFMKPVCVEALSSRISLHAEGNPQNPEPATDMQKTTLMLRELGMPAHLLGFNFVRQAIGLVLKNPTRYGSGMVTSRLYPDIAVQNNTTPSRVERAIRHAIEVSFDRGNPVTLENYFGSTVGSSKGKATNAEFIATVSDRIHVEGTMHEHTAALRVSPHNGQPFHS